MSEGKPHIQSQNNTNKSAEQKKDKKQGQQAKNASNPTAKQEQKAQNKKQAQGSGKEQDKKQSKEKNTDETNAETISNETEIPDPFISLRKYEYIENPRMVYY